MVYDYGFISDSFCRTDDNRKIYSSICFIDRGGLNPKYIEINYEKQNNEDDWVMKNDTEYHLQTNEAFKLLYKNSIDKKKEECNKKIHLELKRKEDSEIKDFFTLLVKVYIVAKELKNLIESGIFDNFLRNYFSIVETSDRNYFLLEKYFERENKMDLWGPVSVIYKKDITFTGTYIYNGEEDLTVFKKTVFAFERVYAFLQCELKRWSQNEHCFNLPFFYEISSRRFAKRFVVIIKFSTKKAEQIQKTGIDNIACVKYSETNIEVVFCNNVDYFMKNRNLHLLFSFFFLENWRTTYKIKIQLKDGRTIQYPRENLKL